MASHCLSVGRKDSFFFFFFFLAVTNITILDRTCVRAIGSISDPNQISPSTAAHCPRALCGQYVRKCEAKSGLMNLASGT